MHTQKNNNGYFELIPEAGNFYKVNFHCHTNISDGKMSALEIKKHYKALGYSAVCFTDHEILVPHDELSDEGFVALHGYEACIKHNIRESSGYFNPLYHFNFISKSKDNHIMPKFFRDHPAPFGNSRQNRKLATNYSCLVEATEYDVDWINEYLQGVVNGGFLVNYNHPQWSLQTANDYVRLKNVHSIEVINGSEVRLNDNTSIHYEQMLRAGMRVCPTAGDDNHVVEETGIAWTMLKAEELSYEALIKAYENGYCYASEGPEIYSLILDGNKIKIKTSPVVAMILLGEGRYAQRKSSKGETYTEAEFDYIPEKLGAYFRIEIRDRFGYKAYSNAYFLDEIERRKENGQV